MTHQTMFRALLPAALIVAIFFPNSRAVAQWSTDPNVNNPICTTPSRSRSNLVMAGDGAGGAFLSWSGKKALGGSPSFPQDPYAQRIDSSGLLPWGAEERVLANNRLDQRALTITTDGAGGANIVWNTDAMDLVNLLSTQVFGQRMDATGNRLWAEGGEFVVAGQGGSTVPVAATDGMGGVILAYTQNFGGAWATRIRSSGDVPQLFDMIEILPFTVFQSSRPLGIVSDGIGGAIVAMENTSTSNLYVQRVDSSGAVRWGTNGVTIVSGGSCLEFSHDLVSDGAGGAIISWTDSRTSYGIYAQRVNNAGVVQWTADGVAIASGATIRSVFVFPFAITDNSGGAIIAWHDTSAGAGLKVQRVNNSGVVQWDSSGVVVAPTDNLPFALLIPAMVTDDSGGAIIAWNDVRNGTSNYDIFAQRVNPSGVTQWTANGVAISTAAGGQFSPVIITNGARGAIIAWLDRRNVPFLGPHIYGQRVNANGQLGGGTTDVLDNDTGIPGMFNLNQSYPNPFNPATTFTFSIPRTANVVLSIYNVLGQEVATVLNETLNAGSYSRTFNAAALASGAYFYRLTAGEHSETKRMMVLK